MNVSKVLADIQAKIKAPKDKENTFGKYKYRNAESILAAFKEVQPEGVALTMSDDVVMVGQRMFLVSKATLWADGAAIATASSAAMHATEKKGMDDAQITGACSSYARKYALCGLFAIDDSTDDPDAGDNRNAGGKPQASKQRGPSDADMAHERAVNEAGANLEAAASLDALQYAWKSIAPAVKADPRVIEAKDKAKAFLTKKTDTDIPY
jgi:hypothetical protein